MSGELAAGWGAPPGDDFGRFEWRAQEIASPDGVSRELRGRRIAVLGCGEAEAAELAKRLGSNGAVVVRVPPAVDREVPAGVHPAVDQDIRPQADEAGLRDLLIESGRVVDGIVDLGAGRLQDAEVIGNWLNQFGQTLDALRIVSEGWARETSVHRCFYAPVLRTGGFLGTAGHVENPHGGLWAGLAKGLAREIPNVSIRIVDFPADCPGAEVAEGVVTELYHWGLFEIGRVGGHRYTPVARRAPAPEPSLRIGGRGVGFELALDLACTLGCRVVVTGRGPVPDGQDEILSMPDEAFSQYRTERVRQAAQAGSIRDARRRLDAIGRERELVSNLARARAAGARVEYRQCDVTDPEAVNALVAELSGSLSVVVHNAGFDAPARLAAKTREEAEAVIRVKVHGMLNLLAAVDDHADPDVFSVAGSLSGRMGGMLGQLDFGAACEGASYFSRWASAISPAGMSAHTLAWPSWERMGTAGSYTAAMPLERGIELWRDEILGCSEGEIAFHADAGTITTPNLVRGYSEQCELPGMSRIASVAARCGDVTAFCQEREFAAAAAWVVAGPARYGPVGVESMTVDIPAMALAAAGPCQVVARRAGRRSSGAAQVLAVAVTVSARGQSVAGAEIHFAMTYPRIDVDPSSRESGRHRARTGNRGRGAVPAWRGFALDLADRSGGKAGPDRLRDQFPVGATPVPVFGYSTIESLVALSYPGGPVRRFSLDGLRIAAAGNPDAASIVSVRRLETLPPHPGEEPALLFSWSVAAEDGFTWMTVAAAGFEPGEAPGAAR